MTLGSDAAVRGYLSAMWREMSEKRYSPDCLRHDQAFHNWLLWSGALGAGVRACSAERGPVSTIGWPEHLYRDRYGRVLNRAGEVAHVVHQFDRRKQLLDSLGARRAERPKNRPPLLRCQSRLCSSRCSFTHATDSTPLPAKIQCAHQARAAPANRRARRHRRVV